MAGAARSTPRAAAETVIAFRTSVFRSIAALNPAVA
jgi:hypothetical protein